MRSENLLIPARDKKNSTIFLWVIGIGLILIQYRHLFSLTQPLAGFDYFWFHLPMVAFLKKSFSFLHMSLWNPHIFSGRPVVQDIQNTLFYPPRWLSLQLPVEMIIQAEILFHIFLGLGGTYFWLREKGCGKKPSIFASVLYIQSMTVFIRAWGGYTPILTGLCWMPWVLYFSNRWMKEWKLPALLGLLMVGSLQFLSSHPHYTFITWLAALFQMIHYQFACKKVSWRKFLLLMVKFSSPFFFILCISAVQLLPSIEFSFLTNRPLYQGSIYSSGYAWHPVRWASIFSPEWLGTPARGDYFGATWVPQFSEESIYIGIFPLVMAFYSFVRKPGFGGILICTGLFLAAGEYNPLFPVISGFVPGMSAFRFPTRYLCLFTLGVVLLMAETLENPRVHSLSIRRDGIFFIISLAVICISTALVHSLKSGYLIPALKTGTSILLKNTHTLPRLAWLVMETIFGLVIWSLWKKSRTENFLSTKTGMISLLLVLFVLPLVTNGYFHGISVKAAITPTREDNLSVDSRLKFHRVLDISTLRTPGYSEIFGYWNVDGFSSYISRDYLRYWNLICKQPYENKITTDWSENRTLIKSLSIGLVLSPTPIHSGMLRRLDKKKPYAYEVIPPPSYFYITHHFRAGLSHEEVFRYLSLGDTTLLVETPGTAFAGTNEPDEDDVKIMRYEPGEIKLSVNPHSAGFLFLSERFMPGWTARLNGTPAKIYRANGLFQSVYLPGKGKYDISFKYYPLSYRVGKSITLVSILIYLLLLLRHIINIKSRRR